MTFSEQHSLAKRFSAAELEGVVKWHAEILAFADGEELEYETNPGVWYKTKTPSFYAVTNYRIKQGQTPSYRPWTKDEVPVGSIVVSKAEQNKFLITGLSDYHLYLNGVQTTAQKVFDNYTTQQGEPCGTKITS